jgi:hypothetical protein
MKLSIDYIIRIYRREPDRPEILVGTAEKVGGKRKVSFSNYDELWQIFSTGKKASGKKKKKPAVENY